MNDETDIERVLKVVGRREAVPAAIERAVREHLRREWRAIVAERQGARRRRTALAMAASVAAAVVGLWLVASQSGLGAGLVGTMAVAQNDVRVRSGWLRGWEPASAGIPLKAGQSLETGPDGRAGIAMPGAQGGTYAAPVWHAHDLPSQPGGRGGGVITMAPASRAMSPVPSVE